MIEDILELVSDDTIRRDLQFRIFMLVLIIATEHINELNELKSSIIRNLSRRRTFESNSNRVINEICKLQEKIERIKSEVCSQMENSDTEEDE